MNTIEIAAILMFFICFFGLITSRKMIKTVIFLVMMQSSVVLFFLSLGFQTGITPPIGAYFEQLEYVADPLPQALMITAIIIGIAVTTIILTLFMSIFRSYRTSDWDAAKEKSLRASTVQLDETSPC